MKAFGYTDKECNNALLNVYRLPAFIGFLIGTVYQYTLTLVLCQEKVQIKYNQFSLFM